MVGLCTYYNTKAAALTVIAGSVKEVAERKRPTVLSNFILPDALGGVFKAKCKHCHKTISGSTKVSTNWLKHMVSSGMPIRHVTSNVKCCKSMNFVCLTIILEKLPSFYFS